MLRKKEEVYIITPLEEGTFQGIKLKKDFSELVFLENIDVVSLKGKEVYVLLRDSNILYDFVKINLPTYNEELLRYRLKQQIDILGYFTSSYEVFYKLLGKEGNAYLVSYIAIKENEISKVKHTLLKAGAKLKGISHLIFTVFSFCELEEFSIVIKPTKDIIWFLLGEKDKLFYVSFQKVDELLGFSEEELKGIIEKIKEYAYRTYEKEVKKIYFLSQEEWEEIEKEYELPPLKLDNSEFINFSEYLGFFFLPKEFNFLSPRETVISDILELSKILGIGLAVIGIINFLVATYLNWRSDRLKLEIEEKLKDIKYHAQEINSQFPPSRIEAIKNLLKEEKKILKLPRIENFFKWCVQNLPNNVKIKEFSLKLQPEGFYTLKCSLLFYTTPEHFNEITTKILQKFSQLLKFSEKKLEYLENKREGKIYLEGELVGEF